MRRHQNDSHGRRLWKLAQGEQDLEMEQHLSNCDTCQEELVTLRQIVHYQQTTGGSIKEIPETLHTTLAGLFGKIRPDLARPQSSTLDEVLAHLRRVTATLVFDTNTMLQPIGLRSGGDGHISQLAFVSDIADLDLEISRRDDKHNVVGQLGMEYVPPGLVISFTPSDDGSTTYAAKDEVETGISDDGHFSLILPPGQWVASVHIRDAILLFPGIKL